MLFWLARPTGKPKPLPLPQTVKQDAKPDARIDALKSFFKTNKCPQLNYDLINDYLTAADQNHLDFRILPSISVIESGCGKQYPTATHNLWGWDSARSGFSSFREGISFVSERLAHGQHYTNKTIIKKLNAYNPNPAYALKVIKLMAEIK
jgi:hypothetical protein